MVIILNLINPIENLQNLLIIIKSLIPSQYNFKLYLMKILILYLLLKNNNKNSLTINKHKYFYANFFMICISNNKCNIFPATIDIYDTKEIDNIQTIITDVKNKNKIHKNMDLMK